MFTEGGCFPPPLSDHMDTMTHNRKQIKLTDLKPDTSNANRGTERGLRVLDDSLAKVGLGRSIVVDKNLNVVAGNKTLERAVDQGFEDAEIIPTQGDKLIVVLREDFDLYADDPNNSARQYAYYDNRSSELDLQWDVEQLLADIQAGFDFDINKLLQCFRQRDNRIEIKSPGGFITVLVRCGGRVAPHRTRHAKFFIDRVDLIFG